MPNYTYQCLNENCINYKEFIERFVPVSLRNKQRCKACRKDLNRSYKDQAPGVSLRGEGWYKKGAF